MRKIFAAAFSTLLAGSSLMQSCSKPDTTPNSVITPPVPADSTLVPVDPTEPPMPTTEPEIIQWAINKLPGKYSMTGRKWFFTDIAIYKVTGQTRTLATDTFGSHTNSENSSLTTEEVYLPYSDFRGKNYFLEFYNFKIINDSNSFYKKIFVDAKGDNFIAAQCNLAYLVKCKDQNTDGSRRHSTKNHNEDINNIKASDFWDVQQFNNVAVDSGKYWAFYKNSSSGGNPVGNGNAFYQVRYYYSKDSLVLFQSDFTNNNYLPCGPDRASEQWQYKFGYSYGRKIK